MPLAPDAVGGDGDGPAQIRRLLLETSDDVTAWRLRIPDGVTFGPVLPAQLNDWVIQGRVSADYEPSQTRADSWTRADYVFPFLATLRASQYQKARQDL